jgi:hypothetical protein
MGVVGLSWYICGLSALLAAMRSMITWAPPGPGPVVRALTDVYASAAFLMGGVAIGLGLLPRTHWVRQSRSLRAVCALAAVSVTVLAMLYG